MPQSAAALGSRQAPHAGTSAWGVALGTGGACTRRTPGSPLIRIRDAPDCKRRVERVCHELLATPTRAACRRWTQHPPSDRPGTARPAQPARAGAGPARTAWAANGPKSPPTPSGSSRRPAPVAPEVNLEAFSGPRARGLQVLARRCDAAPRPRRSLVPRAAQPHTTLQPVLELSWFPFAPRWSTHGPQRCRGRCKAGA